MNNNESYYREASDQIELATTVAWWRSAGGRYVRLLLLALTVSALWLTIEDRWGSNFQFPTRYAVDSH